MQQMATEESFAEKAEEEKFEAPEPSEYSGFQDLSEALFTDAPPFKSD